MTTAIINTMAYGILGFSAYKPTEALTHRFELAVNGPKDLLRRHGWAPVDAMSVSTTDRGMSLPCSAAVRKTVGEISVPEQYSQVPSEYCVGETRPPTFGIGVPGGVATICTLAAFSLRRGSEVLR